MNYNELDVLLSYFAAMGALLIAVGLFDVLFSAIFESPRIED